MISARFDLTAFAARLSQKAKTLAEAQVAENRLSRARSANRWRKAALLWPLFTKG